MSDDLARSDARGELRDRITFEAPNDRTGDDDREHGANDPAQASGVLQAWFEELRQHCVPLVGAPPVGFLHAGSAADAAWFATPEGGLAQGHGTYAGDDEDDDEGE